MYQGGEDALQATCGESDSRCVHHFNAIYGGLEKRDRKRAYSRHRLSLGLTSASLLPYVAI